MLVHFGGMHCISDYQWFVFWPSNGPLFTTASFFWPKVTVAERKVTFAKR